MGRDVDAMTWKCPAAMSKCPDYSFTVVEEVVST